MVDNDWIRQKIVENSDIYYDINVHFIADIAKLGEISSLHARTIPSKLWCASKHLYYSQSSLHCQTDLRLRRLSAVQPRGHREDRMMMIVVTSQPRR